LPELDFLTYSVDESFCRAYTNYVMCHLGNPLLYVDPVNEIPVEELYTGVFVANMLRSPMAHELFFHGVITSP